MCDNFLGVRNKVPHINTEQTLQCLVQAFYSIALVLRKGGKVLIVNKNSEFSPLFYLNTGVFSKEKTTHPKSPSPNYKGETMPATAPLKWVGGCLTNWKEISKSMATLLYFSKRFGRFIKQNNIHFPRFKKMRNSFQGFINVEKGQLLLKERPQLLFLFNANESQQILNEARALQIPVVALADSSTDLSQITYPIPVNSDSVYLVHNCLSQLIQITERQGGFQNKGCFLVFFVVVFFKKKTRLFGLSFIVFFFRKKTPEKKEAKVVFFTAFFLVKKNTKRRVKRHGKKHKKSSEQTPFFLTLFFYKVKKTRTRTHRRTREEQEKNKRRTREEQEKNKRRTREEQEKNKRRG